MPQVRPAGRWKKAGKRGGTNRRILAGTYPPPPMLGLVSLGGGKKKRKEKKEKENWETNAIMRFGLNSSKIFGAAFWQSLWTYSSRDHSQQPRQSNPWPRLEVASQGRMKKKQKIPDYK